MRRLLLLATLFALWAASAPAATYFVDPATGLDSNAGTSTGAAWKTPPGTRNTTNAGFMQAQWGSVATTAKIQCGDTILLKGGSTQTSTQGGSWLLGTSYYAVSCGASTRPTIRVATNAEWSGSTTGFFQNCTGMANTCPAGSPVGTCSGQHAACVVIEGLSSVTLGGISGSQRLRIANSPNGTGRNGDLLAYSGGQNNELQWLELDHANEYGLELGFQTNLVVHDSIAHDNGGPGFASGVLAGATITNVGFVNCESYGNGAGTDVNYGDGWELQDGLGVWVINSSAHDNIMRGFNAGTVSDATDARFRYRNIQVYNNGLGTGWPTSCGPNRGGDGVCTATPGDVDCPCVDRVGFSNSGDNVSTDGDTVKATVVGAIAWGNSHEGFYMGYGDGKFELWNGTVLNNGKVASSGDFNYDRYAADTRIYNTIGAKRIGVPHLFAANSSGGQLVAALPILDYNLWIPQAADSETFSTFFFSPYTATARTFTQAIAGSAGFPGAHDKIGIGFNPNFTTLNDSVYASNDFRVTAGSAAIDAGQGFFTTSCATPGGAGATASTISCLTPNGGNTDPREYLVQPSSFYKAAELGFVDTPRIGNDTVTIVSLASGSISFSPAIHWEAGEIVFLPFNGLAPDMGFYGMGVTDLASSGTTTLPTTTTLTTSTSTTTGTGTTTTTIIAPLWR